MSDLLQGWRQRDDDEQLSPRVAALESAVASLAAEVHRADDAAAQIAALERTVADHGRQLHVRAVMDWIEQATLRGAPLV